MGATGHITARELEQLDARRWVIQPKLDGAYCRLVLDHEGRVAMVLGRSGRPLCAGSELLGCKVGAPFAEIVGELEAHTEAGTRAAATRGYQLVHAFDCLRDAGGRELSGEPYHVRRAALWHMHSALVNENLDQRPVDRAGRAHGSDGRFVSPVPSGWRRLSIVAQHRTDHVGELLDQVDSNELEGVVAIALDAPAGRRGAKRKYRPVDSLDAVCVAVGAGVIRCEWRGHLFTVPDRALGCQPGDLVEIQHSGWYERSVTPRFARAARVRLDLH